MRKCLILIMLLSSTWVRAVQKEDKPRKVYKKVLQSKSSIIPFEFKGIVENLVLGPEQKDLELSKRENLPVEIVFNYETAHEVKTQKLLVNNGQAKLDLGPYVKESLKTFSLRFQVKTENISLDGLRVLFKPYSKRPDNDKPQCNSVSEITSFYNKILRTGIELQKMDDQYLKVLAGQYLFILPSKKKLHLALIEMNNRKKRHLLECY